MTEPETPTNSAVADAWAQAMARAEAAESATTEAPASLDEVVQEVAAEEVAEEIALEEAVDEAVEEVELEQAADAILEEIALEEVEEEIALEEAAAEISLEEAVALAGAEPEEPQELDPEEEFRRAMAAAPGEWFVIHSYAGFENRVRTNLESRITTMNMEEEIFQVEVPIEEVTEIKNGVRKQVKRNKFPGYVLVRMDLTDESWGVVRHTPGVTGFVGHAHQPSPLSLDEVVNILAPKPEKKAGAAATAAAARVVDFEVGDPVTIIEGAFGTMQATISEISPESQKVIVMVELFGRETPVELTFAQIEKG